MLVVATKAYKLMTDGRCLTHSNKIIFHYSLFTFHLTLLHISKLNRTFALEVYV